MNNNFLVLSDGPLGYAPGVLRDRPKDLSEQKIRDYLEAGVEVFKKRLDRFQDPKFKLSPAEEKELRFMMEALIDAKQLLQ